MTLYTKNRGYPYPASEREAGNGGLHSELLARAIQRDLDDLDAAWAAELQHSTVNLIMTGDHGGYVANSVDQNVLFDAAEHGSSGLGLNNFGAGQQTLSVARGGDGWYHVTGSLRAGASGTITAASRHSARLRIQEFKFGQAQEVNLDLVDTYQSGSADISITVESILHLSRGQELALAYFHNNASDMIVRQVGTGLAATQLFRG